MSREAEAAPAPGQGDMPPVIILVEPQLAENIGMVARAMANFGLSELRLVAPRDGWPRKGARQASSGAAHILDEATLFADERAAIADLHFVIATSARRRDQMKRVVGPEPAMCEARARARSGERVGILFGRERTGLENDVISLADMLVTFPADPAFPSLNLAQAVLLVGYEWVRTAGVPVPDAPARSPAARRATLLAFLDDLEARLDAIGYLQAGKRPIMVRNMRDIFQRMALREQDIRTLRGALRALDRRKTVLD